MAVAFAGQRGSVWLWRRQDSERTEGVGDSAATVAETRDEESDDESELLQQSIDEDRVAPPGHAIGPVFTATALSVLRFIGMYLQMIKILKSIAADAVTGASHGPYYFRMCRCKPRPLLL